MADAPQVDIADVLEAVLAKAAQQYASSLMEIARLTAYAQALEKRLSELESSAP